MLYKLLHYSTDIILYAPKKDFYAGRLSRNKSIKTTLSHMVGLLKQYEKYGLVRSRLEGRIRWYSWTNKGAMLKELMEEIKGIIGGKDE